jgi:hypothetical protein
MRGDVVRKMKQPGGSLTATLTLDRGGFATSSLSYRVYTQQEGGYSWEHLHIFDADKGEPVMEWRGSHTLVVRVPCATVFSYSGDIASGRSDGKPNPQAQVLLEFGGMCAFAK